MSQLPLYTVLYCRSTQTHFSAHEVVLCLLQLLVGVILLAYRQNTTRTSTGISKTVQFIQFDSIPDRKLRKHQNNVKDHQNTNLVNLLVGNYKIKT